MNPPELYSLTKEQYNCYQVQPDYILPFHRKTKVDYELAQYLPGTAMRFWLNYQDTNFPTHWHTAMEIIVPLEEHYTVLMESQQIDLFPGDILITPPGVLHAIQSPPAGYRFIFMFEPDFMTGIPSFSNVGSYLNHAIHMSMDSHPQIYEASLALIMKAAEYYWGALPCKELHIYSCLLQLLAEYGDYMANLNNQAVTHGEPSQKQALILRMNLALRFIDDHYADNISLEDVASVAGFSKFYFSRIFTEYTSQTFSEYLSNRRIKATEQMLLLPNMSITTISQECGFNTLSSFNRAFRRIKGCSPSEYRSLYAIGLPK